jgi:dTDP-4-dehydrorhamnose 3,5-epimerase
MNFVETTIAGAWVIEPERIEDERGFFARVWDAAEFGRRGLSPALVQSSIAYTRTRGTLRGLHYQVAPHEEVKLVRCIAGAVFDVAVDLRSASPTFREWFGIELSAENRRSFYVPEGCAHGFLSLADGCEMLYQMTAPHVAEAARGVRFDDPTFAIRWPEAVVLANERDRGFPDFEVTGAGAARP